MNISVLQLVQRVGTFDKLFKIARDWDASIFNGLHRGAISRGTVHHNTVKIQTLATTLGNISKVRDLQEDMGF